MFERVSILIPYKPDNGIRDRNFQWVKAFYETMFPEAEICVGISDEEPFNRAQAINLAAKQATRDIFIIVDGDIFCDPHVMKEAVEQAVNAPWVIPFRKIVRIGEESSRNLLNEPPTWPVEVADVDIIHTSEFTYLGGLNIISRDHFMEVGGFDERFSGWGGEDDAFSCAVNTLCGRYKRLEHTIYHLWHPPVGYENNPNGERNLALRQLYYEANNDKGKMKRVLSQAKSVFRQPEKKKGGKGKQKEPIYIAAAANDDYAEPLAVMLRSLLKNKKSGSPVSVVIIDSEISEKKKSLIMKVAEKYKANVDFQQIDPVVYSEFATFAYLTKETYYRLSIPDLVDETVDKVLYLDCDVVVKKDITELWNTDIRDYCLGAVEDHWVKQSRNADLFMPETAKYFNAGVLLINLKKWREHGVKEKVIEFIRTHPDRIKYCDQDALNAVLYKQWLPLDPKWNFQTYHLYDPVAVRKPAIIHYTGENKPWNADHPLKKDYRKYRKGIFQS
ncbi:glycosyltransferase [Geobacillus sp. 46C-IIa]|uniref:glycosyltransferase n=1 Tax=Geobacillus sp. 46C-IIa TaxID=1963025 RepID=UPI001301D010|nr:glycosyltransferase [Geobacillus sp. 46C-IIa]QNU27141.1 glycosyltransferase [Geobacillus sp. 46C-IIa]